MQIIPLAKDNYEAWDKFCLESNDAWFIHKIDLMEYTSKYKPNLKSKNLSFMLVSELDIHAICPLFIEQHDDTLEFSFGGGAIPAPAFRNDCSQRSRKKYFKLISDQIDKIAKEYNVKKGLFTYTALSPNLKKQVEERLFIKNGYIDVSLNTQIVDLTKSMKELTEELRRDHKRNIQKAEKILEIEIFDKANITRKKYDEYCELHRIAAGRVTRPQATFDVLYALIKKGEGALISAKKEGKVIGFSYMSLYKKRAIYGSACNDPEYSDLPIAHFIQWETIKWLKENKFELYDLGWQQYGPLIYNIPSKKELQISDFKRGFGGFTAPLFMAEKYYNKDYFLKVYQERIKKYSESI